MEKNENEKGQKVKRTESKKRKRQRAKTENERGPKVRMTEGQS